MKVLDISVLNAFLDFIQDTHHFTENGWVHEATDEIYKKGSKLFDKFRESYSGFTNGRNMIASNIETPPVVSDAIVLEVLRERMDEVVHYLREIAYGVSFLDSQVDEIETLLRQQYYMACKK